MKRVAPLFFSWSYKTFMMNHTGYDPVQLVFSMTNLVIHHLGKFLSLRERNLVSLSCRRLYHESAKHDACIKFMRQVWAIPHVRAVDKKMLACRSGLLDCVKLFWYNDCAKDKTFFFSCPHFVVFAAEAGQGHILKFLLEKVGTFRAIQWKEFFMLAVCTLIRNRHFDLAYSIFVNKDENWWQASQYQQYCDGLVRYTCWKEALLQMNDKLCDAMEPTFREWMQMQMVWTVPYLRLLIAARNGNAVVFDHEWNRIQDTETRISLARNVISSLLQRAYIITDVKLSDMVRYMEMKIMMTIQAQERQK